MDRGDCTSCSLPGTVDLSGSRIGRIIDRAITYAVAGVLLLLVLLLSPLILLAILWTNLQDRRVAEAFRRSWPDRQGLLIYSSSPHWQTFVETRWLPLLANRSVVLNWSERATWSVRYPLEHRVFQRFAGSREFNPIAIVLTPGGMPTPGPDPVDAVGRIMRWAGQRFCFRAREVRVVRFWRAFRDYKHGRPGQLRSAEAELFMAFGVAPPEPLPEAGLPSSRAGT